MSQNYQLVMMKNLDRLYMKLPEDLDKKMGAEQRGDEFYFRAFGYDCRIHPNGIDLDNNACDGVMGVLISLYALHAGLEECEAEPLTAYREFPDTMPYAGAFKTHTENLLISFVIDIEKNTRPILDALSGEDLISSAGASADFSFTVSPLPKIRLSYLFYLPDEDFPASVTCLYSSNADCFLPPDALADVGEYTSKRILGILKQNDLI